MNQHGYDSGDPAPRIIVLACKWCGFIGADRAGKERIEIPPQFRLIPVDCAARVEPELILRALADGIDGVAVLGCHLGGCRFNDANHVAAKRLDMLGQLLDITGFGAHRLYVGWGTAHEPHQFVNVIHEYQKRLICQRTAAKLAETICKGPR